MLCKHSTYLDVFIPLHTARVNNIFRVWTPIADFFNTLSLLPPCGRNRKYNSRLFPAVDFYHKNKRDCNLFAHNLSQLSGLINTLSLNYPPFDLNNYTNHGYESRGHEMGFLSSECWELKGCCTQSTGCCLSGYAYLLILADACWVLHMNERSGLPVACGLAL